MVDDSDASAEGCDARNGERDDCAGDTFFLIDDSLFLNVHSLLLIP